MVARMNEGIKGAKRTAGNSQIDGRPNRNQFHPSIGLSLSPTRWTVMIIVSITISSLFCRPTRPERQLEGEDVHGDAARHHSRDIRSQVGTAEVSVMPLSISGDFRMELLRQTGSLDAMRVFLKL